MTDSTKKGVKAVFIIAVMGGLVWYFTKPKTPATLTKKQKVDYLMQQHGYVGNDADFLKYADDYINAWYDATIANKLTFVLSNSTYNTSDGTKINYVR